MCSFVTGGGTSEQTLVLKAEEKCRSTSLVLEAGGFSSLS